MSLVQSREKRANAGSKMHRLLAEEQEDEFYTTTYGGFQDESGDDEYSSEESDADSSSDSDIDAPEDDEPISGSDDEGTKRKRRVMTKSYKEPAIKPASKPALKKSPTSHIPREKKEKSTTGTPSVKKRKHSSKDDSSVRKSSRRSTIQRVNEFEIRIKERETKAQISKQQKTKRKVPEMRRLTQEELLVEAKITEKKNLHSLYLFQQLQEEKKKTKVFKKAFMGPFIRFHSTSMPVEPKIQEVDVNVEKVEQSQSGSTHPATRGKTKSGEKCCRNFITYSEPQMFKDSFPRGRKRAPPKQLCPITRYPARYVDPVTGIAFATKQAFKIIRETYASEIEAAMSGETKHRKSKGSTSSKEEGS
ncbi:vacuolar protein sorting-associated protein 72 homolog [Strongylocentrotus purpuratus]|uniref:Vacuolar protein sorting-associated protein 72 homolog n=1 Tax=Strongylocentrotus purpuratus TaxID=7668 RepID=A0A7M7MY67_STRPU|nr:vacuolar protein sorting-associated protein 72 homolog [Strongylocentrotus purpuratus]